MGACQAPQDDQNHVICCVCQGQKRASSEGQICSEEARRDGDGTGNEIIRFKIFKNEIKNRCHGNGCKPHKNALIFSDFINFDLCAIAIIGVFQPRNERKHRHRQGHSEIGHHLAIIGEGIGYCAIDDAENDHQKLSDGVPLGDKYQRGHPHQRRNERRVALILKQGERKYYRQYRKAPQGDLKF